MIKLYKIIKNECEQIKKDYDNTQKASENISKEINKWGSTRKISPQLKKMIKK